MITGIGILLLAAVSGFEIVLKGVPEVLPSAGKPTLTVRSRSNVRAGDSTSYAIVGKLEADETATILGVSASSAEWYYIELPDGARGFISPDVVQTQGDLTSLETIDPATLSTTATPVPPTAEATQPAATAVATEPPDDARPATPTPSG